MPVRPCTVPMVLIVLRYRLKRKQPEADVGTVDSWAEPARPAARRAVLPRRPCGSANHHADDHRQRTGARSGQPASRASTRSRIGIGRSPSTLREWWPCSRWSLHCGSSAAAEPLRYSEWPGPVSRWRHPGGWPGCHRRPGILRVRLRPHTGSRQPGEGVRLV
jgi:hypothetical protein